MKKYILLTIISFLLTTTPALRALPTDSYARSSRLAEGTWVKVAVTNTGMHILPTAKLREWGFNDPSRVRVFGTGGKRIPDALTAENLVDDLAQVQTLRTAAGITFYADGPTTIIGPDASGLMDHLINPWDVKGYYYITDSDAIVEREIPVEGSIAGNDAATTFTDYAYHETDLVSPGESGHMLVGEDFRFNPRQTFNFNLPGRVEGSNVSLTTRFFSFITSGSPILTIEANGTHIGTPTRLKLSNTSSYGDTCRIVSEFSGMTGTKLTVGLNLSSTGMTRMANLNSLGISYQRALQLPTDGHLMFTLTTSSARLGGYDKWVTVWDVTNPLAIIEMKVADNGSWQTPYTGTRRYVAFAENANLPRPEYVGRVANQNIHGEPVPDMVIVTNTAMRSQAERIAEYHRNSADALRVLVVLKEHVWNEFSSGVADINGVRRMLKMFYDRGTSSDGHRLRYALMMGRPFYDHRHLTETMRTSPFDNMPIWQTDSGTNESYSYCSDDYLAMLADGGGATPGSDKLEIAVGRIAVRDADEAKTYVDKLMAYNKKLPSGDWKNKIVILADDQDNGVHLEQAEDIVAYMNVSPSGSDFMINKVYIDAYEKINGVTEAGREQMYKWLNEGAMWLMYVGHASIDTWTTEGMVTRKDLLDNMYFRRLPILYAATCTFQRWDGVDISGSEMMVMNPSGGAIASICPVRPVYISSNGVFSRQMGSKFLERDETGRFLPIGEIVRRAKNMGGNDTNKLRYVIFGDPAMRVPTPDNRVVLDNINDEPLDSDNPPTIMAHQRPVFTGHIADWQGNILTDYNGTLTLTIYDAEESVTTLGRGDDSDPGKESVFERQGGKLYSGCAKIENGRFAITVAMPSEIAWNYRNAAVNMYAAEFGTGIREAIGMNRNFYVYGYDESVPDDLHGPSIDALYLNHSSFTNGDVVNESPMMFARVSDDVGINLSTAGIGHTLLMRIDDTDGFTDVSDYYTPESDGTPAGTVAYPINELVAGNHTLTFRVWDTSNNFSESKIDFYVQPGLTPQIFDIYTDTNPAYTEANFYVNHNRPDATLTVTIEVFDLMGRPVWSRSSTGRSDMFVSSPITWNLTDRAGRRVNRGIYLYRATVSTDGVNETSEAKRIAVAAE